MTLQDTREPQRRSAGQRRRWRAAVAAVLLACTGGARRPTRATPLTPYSAVRDSVRAVLRRALADSAFPGAFAVVGSAREIYASVGVGHLDWAPSPAPDDNTLWDLASLTKVVGMTTAMMQLWDAGRIQLDAPVRRYLPEFHGARKDLVTVRHLLTHTSGLPAWRALYLEAPTPDSALALVFDTPLDTVPGARTLYSDLGAILLGKIIERVSGEPLDRYLREHVFAPLEMESTMYRPRAALLPRVAPTEIDPWRGRHLRGEVHDENAFVLGGVSAHAGLFSTARDLSRFAQMLLSGGRLSGAPIVSAAAIDTFTAVQDPTRSNRALGWEVPTGDNSAGHRLSVRSFGHTGFTGTSLWIDRDRGVFVLLLSNRVNPSRENRRISAVRIALADAVIAALDATDRAPRPLQSGISP